MDACRELFECGRDSCDDNLMNHILRSMNQYMEKYPDEIKVGLEFAELIYVYAVGKMDKDAILEALEAKNYYKDRIIEYSKVLLAPADYDVIATMNLNAYKIFTAIHRD